MAICYGSPTKLVYPMILFTWHSRKSKAIGTGNTSVLPKGWVWGEMNDYKKAQVKTPSVCQNSKTWYLKRMHFATCELQFNKPDYKEYSQCEWPKKKKKKLLLI